MRSTRKIRQSSRSRSQARRYQRPAFPTTACGSARRGAAAAAGRVVESQHDALLHRARHREQHRRLGARSAPRDHRDVERVDPRPQAWRQHLAERGECPVGSLLDPGAGRGGRPQRDGDRDRLVVVEQQRRQLGPGVRAGSRRPDPSSPGRRTRARGGGRRPGAPCARSPRAGSRAAARASPAVPAAARAARGAATSMPWFDHGPSSGQELTAPPGRVPPVGAERLRRPHRKDTS